VVERNKLDQTFGSAGTSAGIFLVFVGVIVSCVYPSALVLILIGGFVGFTSTSVLIDYTNKKVKFANNIFGFIPVGRWVHVDPSMRVDIRKSNLTYRAFSRGNRPLDLEQHDFRLVLLDLQGVEIMPLKKFTTREVAMLEVEMMEKRLGLTSLVEAHPVIGIKAR